MRRRTGLVALAATIGVAGLAAQTVVADTVGLPDGSQVRLSGSDRYATAVEVSKATFAPPVDVVFVATGENFPDALAAGPAAGKLPAPVLLVRHDSVPPSVVAELERLGPDLIVVLGGPSVIDDAVLAQLDDLAGDTGAARLFGATRYHTAALLATEAFLASTTDTVLLATGTNYPDALSAGSAGATIQAPILLATPNEVPAPTLDAMKTLGISEVVFLGGPTALPESLKSQITDAIGPVSFDRLAGSDRYATSAAIAGEYFSSSTEVAYLAVGDNFPDALGGAPSAGVNGAPILLSRKECMPTATYDALQALDVSKVVLLGGSSVLSGDAPMTVCSSTNPPGPAFDPAYPTVEIPAFPPDLDCGDIPFRNFPVLPPDPHGFDSDENGIGCET